MSSGLFYFNLSLDRSIYYIRGVWAFLLSSWFVENSELKANSAHPDQTPRSVASDLGLHYFPMSLLWDARLKWVKVTLRFHISSVPGKCCALWLWPAFPGTSKFWKRYLNQWAWCKYISKICRKYYSHNVQSSLGTTRRRNEEKIMTVQTSHMNPLTHKQRRIATEEPHVRENYGRKYNVAS